MLELVSSQTSAPGIIPGAYLDQVDLQHPVDPNKPKKFVWLASTDEVLSLGIVIDHGKAVIASLDQSHIVGIDPQEVKISVSDFMDPHKAQQIAQESIRQWIVSKVGPSKVYSARVNTAPILKEAPLIQDLREKRPQEIMRRVNQSGIPFHVYAALLNASTEGFLYRYIK